MRYVVSFTIGLGLAGAALAVAAAFGHAADVPIVDAFLAVIGLVIAGAMALGVNLGNWIAIRSLDDYGRTVAAPGAALRLALTSIGLFVGGMLTANIVG